MKEKKYKLEEINKKNELGLKYYEPGNILLIHLDFSKTESQT
jgi:hypothetical protein